MLLQIRVVIRERANLGRDQKIDPELFAIREKKFVEPLEDTPSYFLICNKNRWPNHTESLGYHFKSALKLVNVLWSCNQSIAPGLFFDQGQVMYEVFGCWFGRRNTWYVLQSAWLCIYMCMLHISTFS